MNWNQQTLCHKVSHSVIVVVSAVVFTHCCLVVENDQEDDDRYAFGVVAISLLLPSLKLIRLGGLLTDYPAQTKSVSQLAVWSFEMTLRFIACKGIPLWYSFPSHFTYSHNSPVLFGVFEMLLKLKWIYCIIVTSNDVMLCMTFLYHDFIVIPQIYNLVKQSNQIEFMYVPYTWRDILFIFFVYKVWNLYT